VQQLRHLDGVTLVERLAQAGFGTGAAAAGKSMASAETVTAALGSFEWDRLAPLRQAMASEGPRAASAAAIIARLQDALVADEIVTAVGPALRRADREIFEWLAGDPPPPPPPPPPGGSAGSARRRVGASDDELLRQVREFLESHADRDVDVTWQVRE